MRLVSWTVKGHDWGSQTEVQTLQMRVTNMLGKNVGLTIVVQIMLFHRILPCRWFCLRRWFRPRRCLGP